jgi:hypothetical protein
MFMTYHNRNKACVAYGWSADLTDEQTLEPLLALNLERSAEEATAPKVKNAMSREKRDDEVL